MFEKRVSQSERRIRNSHVTSIRTGTPLGSNSNCQVYTLALESAHTPKAHDNRSELRNKPHRADSAMPRNPAKDSRPSFGRAHVRPVPFPICGWGHRSGNETRISIDAQGTASFFTKELRGTSEAPCLCFRLIVCGV